MSVVTASRRAALLAAVCLPSLVVPAASAAPLLPRPAAIEGTAGTSWQAPLTVKATFRSARLSRSAPATARVLLIGGKPGSSLRYRLGTLEVPALKLGATKQLTTTLTPPARLGAASYRLAICVGRYPKTRCRTSSQISLRVPQAPLSEPVATPAPTQSPTPSPSPTAAPTPEPTPTPTPAPQGKLTASETDVAFGAVPWEVVEARASRYMRTVMLENTGAAPLPALSFPAAPFAGTPFSLSVNACTGVALAPGQRCMLLFATAPALGQTASASVTASAGSQSVTITVSATGAAGPKLVMVSKPKFGYKLGDVFAGEPATQTLTIRNDGDMPEEALAFTVSSPKANAFSITADTCSGKVLAPGATCTADVKLTVDPSQSGPETVGASVTVGGTWVPNADTATFGVTVHGPRTAPQLSLDAATLKTTGHHSFGTYTALAALTAKTFTVTNRGTERSGPIRLTIPAGFSITPSSTCDGTALSDGASCELGLIPTLADWQTLLGTVEIFDDSATTPSAAITVHAVANVGPAPKLELVSGNPDWGPTTLAKPVTKVFTFKNTGSTTFHSLGWSLTTSPDDVFSGISTTCTTQGVAPGGFCTVTVRATFTPGASWAEFNLVPAFQGMKEPVLKWTGTGTDGSISAAFSPASWTFFSPGSKRINVSFAGSTVNAHNVRILQKVGNRGPVTLGITEDTCTGNDFTAAQTCSFLVTFTGDASYADATLSVEADGEVVASMPVTINNS